MKRNHLIIFIILINSLVSNGQGKLIDSIQKVLAAEKEDTFKVKTLNSLSDKLEDEGKYDSAIACAINADSLAERLEYKLGIAASLGSIGIIYDDRGDYTKALEYYFKALAIDEEIGDKNGVGRNYSNIGVVYNEQGNYPKALEFYFNALSKEQELGNKIGTAVNLGNIGIIYKDIGSYPKALEYYFKALTMDSQLHDKQGIGINLANIGVSYQIMGNYSEALKYMLHALGIDREIGYKNGIASDLSCIGIIYRDKSEYLPSIEYNIEALAINREIGNKNGIAANLANLGDIYIKQKKYTLAKIYFDSALFISKEIGAKDETKGAYSYMAKLDSCKGDFKTALEDYKKYISYRDSLINEANTKKTVQSEMNFEFEQKQATEKAKQDKKDAVADQERRKQKVIKNAFILGFVLMLALAFFIFSGYRQKQKDNEIITLQKEEVEEQKNLVEQQKVLVDEKNKDILDSITYAKRLQDAILPPISLIRQYLPESFVLYKPKDIVAGDFYWMEKSGGTILLAAADCTGHGVPGAMVSVVCSNALNRTVKEFKITEPGKILDKVLKLVLETFEKSESNVHDGMDISLATISYPPTVESPIEIKWSGAYNPLLYIRNGELQEILADKQPVGKNDRPLPFNTHSLQLKEGDILYLFTDGYSDQFGGPKGKKFKFKQLKEFLLANANKSMDEQKKKLELVLNEWKGELEQVDDVLIIGIRV
jgi:tetratricopeptide (TPR) repeat protein